MTADPISAALRVAEILEKLRIPYLLVGSVASSIHGEPRTTEDVDVVVARLRHIAGTKWGTKRYLDISQLTSEEREEEKATAAS